MIDILTFIPIIVLVILLFFLSDRETKKSLEQSKASAKVLAQDRNALQLKLNESTRALRESELARINELTKAAEFGRLAQGLFHDLMTPLTSIILHTEKLKDRDITHKNMERAVEAGNRMARYIQDIRTTLSHEESERECILSEELDSILHLLAYKAKTGAIEIAVTKQDRCTWYGNPLKMRQIFSNLISNAIDSFEKVSRGPEQNVKKKIQISITKSSLVTTIEIRDNGSGISPQNMEKVFEPFFTTKAFNKGTGIGLSTVKSIVEKDLKGKIEMESQEGTGTLFRIIFPTQYKDPASSPPLPQTPPPLG